MKHFLVIAAAVFLNSTVVNAQQAQQQYMNFQGKLFLNNIPVNSPTSGDVFKFNIPSLPWTQKDTLFVHNGLYSTTLSLPATVFDSANYQRELIIYYNNNPLDTVILYAPVERDPSVRRYIRDSVQWVNVHNKPTVDTSFTNEIQTLSLNGDTLGISGGNTVLLHHFSDTLHSTYINGILTVFDTSQNVMATVPQSGIVVIGAVNQVYWQSFKATANGKLRKLKLTVGASGSGSITVSLYSGTGNGSLALAYKTFTISNTASLQTLDLSAMSGQPYVSVTNGQVYTFEVKPSAGNTISILTNPANPYPAGISSISNTTDIPFEMSIDNSVPSCLTFDNNCRVGIGTDAPTAQLEVKGRIKDQTGFVMPVGFISAYGGRNIPEGWLLCDGRAISRTAYADLFEAIDTSWGAGNGASTFNLPDLRGQFLRGVDTSANVGTSNADPEHATRVASNTGGNIGNNVGSKQADMFGSHSHSAPYPFWLYQNPGGCCIGDGIHALGSTATTNSAGGTETRPKNVYVYYIIKY